MEGVFFLVFFKCMFLIFALIACGRRIKPVRILLLGMFFSLWPSISFVFTLFINIFFLSFQTLFFICLTLHNKFHESPLSEATDPSSCRGPTGRPPTSLSCGGAVALLSPMLQEINKFSFSFFFLVGPLYSPSVGLYHSLFFHSFLDLNFVKTNKKLITESSPSQCLLPSFSVLRGSMIVRTRSPL